jgi:hypothetical protein
MKKFLVLFAVTALAVTALSVGYALWSTTLTIDGTVNTGTVEAEWSVERAWVDEIKPGTSRIFCEGHNTDLLTVRIENAYPSAHYYCLIDIHSLGTIPVHIGKIVITDDFVDPDSVVEIVPDPSGQGPPIRCSTQLHQSERAWGLLHIHLDNDEPQDGTLTFRSKINVNQYNEPEDCS